MSDSRTTVGFHLDEKLLEVEKEENLAKSYASLKNIDVAADHKKNKYCCEVINQPEVSAAYDIYLQRIQSAVEIPHESSNENLLNFYQKILKIDTHYRKNENTGSNSSKDENQNNDTNDNIDLTSKTINQESAINANCSKDPENSVTVDDFLTEQREKKEYLKPSSPMQIVSQEQNDDQERGEFFHTSSNVFFNDSKEIHKKELNDQPEHRTSTMYNDEDSEKDTTSISFNGQKFKKSEPSLERPYACPKCEMSFKRNLHLKRHFAVSHTVNKNFRCETCGKMFSRKDYLDKHVSGHQKKNLKLKLLQQGIVVRTKMFSKSNK